MRDFENVGVKEKFQKFKGIKGKRLRDLRELIFDVAESDRRIGYLSEQLRWGDPSYITSATKAGSTVRLGCFKKDNIAIFFHCKTTLIPSFRGIYGNQLEYSKNRAILMEPENMPDTSILEKCVYMSLTYNLKPQFCFA